MSDTKLISPLLDGFALGNPISDHDGVRCCPAIKENSDKKYIVKIISIPASQVQMDALLLAGAYKDTADAMDYFEERANDVLQEAQFLKDISRLDGFLPYEGWQMEPITKRRLGYEVYLVGTYKRSLEKYVRRNPITHLEAVNLGLDLCSALSVCRQAGALYMDLKPANIFVSEKKEYRIGDLGFIQMDALKYTALPEKYRSCYTPPELHDPMASLNLTADTYALGMILYQIYNEGRLPFKDQAPEEVLPTPVNADYELAEIIMKAIHPDPQQRWQDPSEMGQALVGYMQRNEVNDVPITPYTPLDIQAQNVQIPREEPPADEAAKPQAVEFADPEVPVSEEAAPEETEADVESAAEEEPAEDPVQEEALPADTADKSDAEPESDEVIPQPEDILQTPVMDEIPAEEPVSAADAPAEPEEIISQSEIPVQPTDELSRIIAKADDLISHETPVGVVLPEIPDPPDPFAFALEDYEDLEDFSVPIDPIMEEKPDNSERQKSKRKKSFRSTERKRKVKKFFSTVLLLLILAFLGLAAFWYYQTIYLQTIDSITIDADMDKLSVSIQTNADESLLSVICSDNYGNSFTSGVSGGKAEFTDLLPNTMYKVELEIEGFHALVGQTSDVYTTDTTTSIVSFTAITGPEDGSVMLNFTVDGDEPSIWTLHYGIENEEKQTETFTGHSITLEGLSLGKIYTFTLDAGDELSLSGKTAIDFMASRLILAENLTATTTNGTDMTIHWTTPGDTVVESWDVRCYNDSGYEKQLTVTETEVYLTEIDPSVSYTVEVTAAGMTQPARTSITANPINITALNVDEEKYDELTVSWEYAGTTPEGGWLLMYSVDGSSSLNVIKCDKASASISPRIPDAKYQFTIQSVDGTSIFGNVHTYSCPSAEAFDQNGLSAENITAELVKTPEKVNWTYDSIGRDAITDQFVLGDKISIVLHGSTNFYLPGSELNILYVIRDSHGNVLPDYVSEAKDYWKDIWNGGDYHYGELDLPTVPDKAGSYVLSIYFNGDFVADTTFTISE